MVLILVSGTLLAAPSVVLLDNQPISDKPPQTRTVQGLTASQLFEFAERSRLSGNYVDAEQTFRALEKNPDLEIRTEARFRLAMMYADEMARYSEAALLFRRILDEKPDAARVRIELGRMHLMLGNERSAERQFRAAQTGKLPIEVEQLVRFYAQTLADNRPIGASFQVSIAPDSNVNRATKDETLGTIIGDFTLSDDARSQSGIGLAIRGHAYARTGLERYADLLLRVSASGNFYRVDTFDDYSLVVRAGPEYQSGVDRLKFTGIVGWRWFGQSPLSLTYGGEAEWSHPTNHRTQLRINATITHREDRQNPLRSVDSYAASAGIERAFSSRFGAGLRLQAQRDVANDPGYSQFVGRADVIAYREFGPTTVVLDFGYSRLEADKRLFLFPKRRVDNSYSASFAATLRSLRVGRFAPLIRFSYENNQSTVSINEFDRIAGEIGVSAAF